VEMQLRLEAVNFLQQLGASRPLHISRYNL
jgi:hypothetical protein